MTKREIGWPEVLWVLFLAGLPFAHFVNHRLDIWHAQTAWAQAGLAAVLALTLVKTQRPIVRNVPMALWLLWVCWQTLFIWQTSLQPKQPYPAAMLMPWLHALCVPLFYLAATTQWTAAFLEELSRWLARGAAVLVSYGVLQWLNLDQFYRHVEITLPDPLIGTIGNSSHFGVQLALLLPLVLHQPRWYWKGLAGLMLGLIVLTHSAVGAVGGLLALGWWCRWSCRRLVWLPVMLVLLGGLWVAGHPAYLNPEGRLQAWRLNWQEYATPAVTRQQGKPTITGLGGGYIMARSQALPPTHPLTPWKHVHNVLLQTLMEWGVPGFCLLLWGLAASWRRFWSVRAHPLAVMCGGMLLVFSFSSFFHFIDHLWVTASLGLLGYCGIYVLAAEQGVRT